MIRIVLFLVIIGVLSLGAAWLADRPDVVILWQGLRIKTSPLVLAGGVAAALAALLLIVGLIWLILRSPGLLSRRLQQRRGLRSYQAISNGLIAVGSGDIAAAQKHSALANRLAPGEPLTLLLNAQSAQLAGDRDGADRAFRAMAGRGDTKPLGLHGLFVEAHRRNDTDSARAYAEEAIRTAPSLHWANRAVLEARCKAGDWAGALALLEGNVRLLAQDVYRRQRAVLLTAQAQSFEDTDRERAKNLAREAQKLAPTLVPATTLAARLLAEGGEGRKARRMIETAWRASPHPDLAQAYSELRSGESALQRLKRIEALAAKIPDHPEGALAVARAALDAQEFAKARGLLAPYLAVPTKRVALMMAELERAERNDEGRAREWLARAVHAAPDPAWTADGHVSARWLPASPVTGRLDAFEWRVPLTGIAAAAAIEPDAKLPVPADGAADPAAGPGGDAEQRDSIVDSKPQPSSDTAALESLKPKWEPKPDATVEAEPIIPLVHAPDDPGPDGEDATDSAMTQDAGGWRKILG